MNFLNYQNWQITELKEGNRAYTVSAQYQSPVTVCRNCAANAAYLIKFGVRVKFLKDAPVHGKIVCVYLTVQRYKCRRCRTTFCDEVPEVQTASRFTKRLIRYVEKHSIRKNFRALSEETGVSEPMVREIFTRFIERNCQSFFDQTPEILGIDEVYVRRIARCILTDIGARRIVELLPKRDRLSVCRHLLQMQNKDRIKFVTMDMWHPYRSAVKLVLPSAKIIVDRFHLQRMLNQAINIFLRRFRETLTSAGRRKHLRDRFLLMKRHYKLTAAEKESLSGWLESVPQLCEIYRLKEEFLLMWNCSTRERAEEFCQAWRRKIPESLKYVFKDLLTALSNWREEIFNYFDFRVTNAFTESANNLIKTIQRDGRCYSFEVIRAKILYRKLLDDPEDAVPDYSGETGSRNLGEARVKRLRRAREKQDFILSHLRALTNAGGRFEPYRKYFENDKYL